MGTTPSSVGLERNRDHILTLVKENYRQEDVLFPDNIKKKKVYLKAIQSGINSGLFFKDARMGMGSSMSSVSAQEDSGEAYVLVPPAVKLTLTPVAGFVPPAYGQQPVSAARKPAQESPAGTAEPALNKRGNGQGLVKIGAGGQPLRKPSRWKKPRKYHRRRKFMFKSDGTRFTEKIKYIGRSRR